MARMRSRSIRFVLASVLFSFQAGAQVQSHLDGRVTDASTSVLPGAKITVRNLATGVALTAVSNDSGGYVFPTLLPGEYELRCEAAGFKSFLQTGIGLETGQAKTIDIQLEVGVVSETVQVKASSPLLETGNATLGQFIERSMVQNIPLDTRRIGSLARLAGGVAFQSENGKLATPQFSMSGSRSQNQMWLTDGAASQNMTLGTPQSTLNPPAEAVQEIKMETSNYAAEFGRAGGGLILITTRSGTNQFHGAVYEFFRNDKLNSRTFFSPGKAPLRYNTFGASAGGPIFRNKTFFFVNYEGDRRRTGTTVSYTVPNPAEITGDFSQRKDVAVKDPVTGNAFPGNIIPASRIDPIGQAYARFYAAPNAPFDPTRAPASNFLANPSDPLTRDFLTVKVDHSISQNDRVFARIFRDNQPSASAPVFSNIFADPRATNGQSHEIQVLGDWIHNFTPTLFHEVRYLYADRLDAGIAPGAGSGLNGKLGLGGVDPNFAATVSATGYTSLGIGSQSNLQTPIRTHQLIDTLTWVKGRHEVKMGGEYRYTLSGDALKTSAGGNFSFSDRATGNGLATLLLGWTTSASLVNNDFISGRSDYWGAFIQDSWKLSSRLTLNLGLRWEMDTPRWDTANRQSGFNTLAINPVSGTPGIVTFAGLNGVGKYANDFDPNNVAPKVALAWRVTNGLVIRSGYGIFYYGEYADSVVKLVNQGYGLNGSFTSPDGGFTPAFLFKNGMPAITREALTPAFGAVPVGGAPRLSPDYIEQNHPTAYSQQWNFTIQKELPKDMLLETAYLGNAGHKLGGQSENINQIPLVNGKGPAKQDQTLRPFPQFNSVTSDYPAWGNSTYHALNVKLEKRYANGLNFLMNYTWSKFLDDVQGAGEIASPPNNGYEHIELRKLNKSYSGNDIPQRFIVSSVYDLPVGRGRHFRMPNPVLEQILGGWGLGAIAEFHSGPPYGVIEQTNTSNTFSDGQRPNLLHSPDISGSRSRGQMVQQYFDTTAFGVPAVGTFGNAAREVGFGPGMIEVDLSVHKTFPLTERFRLAFRSEFINLPNHPNFANPNQVQGNASFGRITSISPSSSGREVEFSLRLEW